uniref:Uncharacterized protein n=1 Tax=Parascaris equorum TaxID=6256 RepID=A0A914RVE5_PAREQ
MKCGNVYVRAYVRMCVWHREAYQSRHATGLSVCAVAMMSDGAVSVLEHFLSACEAWNLDEVHRVVESGFNVDAFDDDHVTGLQM